MLGRSKERQFMFVFFPEKVVSQATTIDHVLGLFGNITFERFKIELITTSTEFIGRMIFDIQTAKLSRTIVSTKTESIHVQLTDFRETVPINIIWITITIRLINGNTIDIVFGNERSIGSHVLFPCISIDIRHGRRYLE